LRDWHLRPASACSDKRSLEKTHNLDR
jgi:hypothetical protein